MADQRVLRPTPSAEKDLQPWQLTLSEDLSKLHQEAHQERIALTHTVQAFPKPTGEQALIECAFACRIAYNVNEEEAQKLAEEILKPGSADFLGSRDACILSFSFEDESLWRGPSDNKKLIRLARNMVTSGYKRDEPIRSRTFDHRSDDGVLAAQFLFGDGQARGLSARLAWQLLLNFMRSKNETYMGDPEFMRVVMSLLHIPVVFEKSGQNTKEDLMMAQVVRQNMKAKMSLPLNTLEWAKVVLMSCSQMVGGTQATTGAILACLERCKAKYDSHIEVAAYDVEPVAKRARKGRRKSASSVALALASTDDAAPASKPADDPDEDQLKIGYRRLKAISNILSHSTKKSYKAMEMHLVWAGNYDYSALSDRALGLPYIFPNSLPPPEAHADLVTQVARDAAAKSNRDLVPPNATVRAMKYEELLTSIQHEQIFDKVLTCYEDEVLHLSDRNAWLTVRPKDQTWLDARLIIQHWDLTLKHVCEADLPKAEFDELEKAVLFGDAMDSQILSVIKRFPKQFHIGMIPDMKTTFTKSDMDEALTEQMEAEHASWASQLRLFRSNLVLDQKTIQRTELGSAALHDILEWHESGHVRQQGLIGKNLVQQFTNSYFPSAVSSGWPDVPGAIALAVQTVHNQEGAPKAATRMVAVIDFNVPNARDALKMKEMITAVTNIFKNNNPNKCVLLAHMAAYAKEDTDNDPLEDEVLIKDLLKKAGFGAQQQVRMLFTPPANIQSSLRIGDWHADSRLCYLSPNDLAARGLLAGKGMEGNEWRMHSELARTTCVTNRPTLPNAHEYVRVTCDDMELSNQSIDTKIDKEAKAAQRGPLVAAAYMEALFTKAAVSSVEGCPPQWLEPGQETIILDITPHVGDRAMGTLMMLDDPKYGTLRHIILDSGYKRMGQGASFTLARVSNATAEQWMNRTRVLHDRVQDGVGTFSKVARQPLDSVPDPDEALLKETPGAYEAWKGLSSLDLKVCVVRGPKIVVAPEKVSEFQHAPLSISEEVRRLEEHHTKEFEDCLAYMAIGGSVVEEVDPRPSANPEGDTPPVDLPKFDSLAALEAHAPNLLTCQAAADKHVTLLKDDARKEVWMLAKNDDHIVPKHTLVGGYGGGQVGPRKLDRSDVVPWHLPNGDKTYIQLQVGPESEDPAEQKTQSKPKSGTLYVLAKPLEKNAAQNGASLTLTSYGKLKPEGTAGKHGFGFEFAEENPKHVAQDYILSTAKTSKISSGNFFANLATRHGWNGQLMDMWRLGLDNVRHAMHAKKPFVVTSEVLSLKKGVPVKVMWVKQPDLPSPNPAPLTS